MKVRTFQLDMVTENAAFTEAGDRGETEIARVLRAAADRVEQGRLRGEVVDANGNTVGWYGATRSSITPVW